MNTQKAPGDMRNNISLQQLYFDPENPRLSSNSRDADDGVILDWMLKKGNILELMSSIAATGYSDAEPLLVTQRLNGDGYTVVEGNRRLAALKLLASPQLANLRKKAVAEIASTADIQLTTSIPSIVYPRRDDILDYLGYRHITGIKPWGPRQKAEYLKQLLASRINDGIPPERALPLVAEMIGSKPYYARKLLISLAVVEMAEENAFWGSESLDRIDANFSVFHTALSYENIRDYVGIDEADDWNIHNIKAAETKNILEWVCGSNKIIGESRELRRLNAVIGNDVALAKLKSGLTLEIAAEYTGEALDDFRKFLNDAYVKLQEADRLASRPSKFAVEDMDLTENVARLARKIYGYVKESNNDNI
jgi:hypothetical protein